MSRPFSFCKTSCFTGQWPCFYRSLDDMSFALSDFGITSGGKRHEAPRPEISQYAANGKDTLHRAHVCARGSETSRGQRMALRGKVRRLPLPCRQGFNESNALVAKRK